MWDKQPKGKTTCTECQFQGRWRSRTALAFCKAEPGNTMAPPTPTDRARLPYFHHADKPSVREPAQAAAATRSFAPAPRPAEAQLPSRTAPGNTTTRQRPRQNRPPPAWAAPVWPGPSRHAPLAAWPLSLPAAPRPAPPVLAGVWGAGAEAMAAEARQRLRPPCLYVPVEAGGREGSLSAITSGGRSCLCPAFSLHPPFSPEWALLSSSYRIPLACWHLSGFKKPRKGNKLKGAEKKSNQRAW